MILTYKVKHEFDFSAELKKAKQIAEFAIEHRTLSSADVKQFGLKSIISNQILRKYSRNKKAKSVKSVKLTIPKQGIKLSQKTISISSLKVQFPIYFKCRSIKQIEVDEHYFYVSVARTEKRKSKTTDWIGVDLNTNGHAMVVANPLTGKVLKLGKRCKHIHNKYSAIRKRLQAAGAFKKLKQIKRRESNIVKDLNHKMSAKLVSWAKENNTGIKFEYLKGIRKAKHAKSFRYTLNSWSYYQLQQFVDYKAKLDGIPVAYVDPAYTSKTDSRTGLIGTRRGFDFKSISGIVEHSGVNAAFNIALRKPLSRRELDARAKSPKSQRLKRGDMSPFHGDIQQHRLRRDRDLRKGNTDIPQEAMSS